MGKEKRKLSRRAVINCNFWMYKRIFSYTPDLLILTVLQGVLMGINGAVEIMYIKKLYDYISAGTVSGGEIFHTALKMMVVYTVYRTLYYFYEKWYWQVYIPAANERLHIALHSDMFRKAVSLDLDRYDNPQFYNDFIWSMDEAYSRATQLMTDTCNIINRIVSSLAVTSILFSVDGIMATVIFVLALCRIFFTVAYNKQYLKFADEDNPLNRKDGYIRRVFMLPDYAKELRATRVSESLYAEYIRNTEKRNEVVKKYSTKRAVLSVLQNTVMLFGETGLFIFVLYKVMNGQLTLGAFSVAMGSIWRLSWSLRDLVTRFQKFHEHAIFIEKVQGFVKCQSKIADGQKTADSFESLTISGLGFAYNDGATEALNGVDLTINKGEKIAIVGYNGAGKTTLTKLIMRLYDPTRGEILYNGENIKEYSLESLRSRVAAVFQDYRIFASTLAENVAGGECDVEDTRKIKSALEKSTFGKKLSSLPDGLNTQLTREFYDSGTVLSGGEQQKVAIARAFYKDADLIILDEPSSALDPDAEYELNRSITEYAGEKTVIFISHRLSTTRHADRIYMFDDGRLIEIGTHGELMAQNGKYAYMFNLQAEKYRKGK